MRGHRKTTHASNGKAHRDGVSANALRTTDDNSADVGRCPNGSPCHGEHESRDEVVAAPVTRRNQISVNEQLVATGLLGTPELTRAPRRGFVSSLVVSSIPLDATKEDRNMKTKKRDRSRNAAAAAARSRYVRPPTKAETRLYELTAIPEHEITIGEHDEMCDLLDRMRK